MAAGAHASRLSQLPANEHLAAVSDEEGHLTVVDTNSQARPPPRRASRPPPG